MYRVCSSTQSSRLTAAEDVASVEGVVDRSSVWLVSKDKTKIAASYGTAPTSCDTVSRKVDRVASQATLKNIPVCSRSAKQDPKRQIESPDACDRFAHLINESNSWGLTYLMAACQAGNIDLINSLIEAGSDLDMKDRDDCTAFHYAVSGKQHTVVPLIASKGANAEKCNAQGNSLLHLAVETGCKDMINKQNVNGDTPLLLACHRGNTEVIQQLLLYKPDVNLENKHNNTPLHWACSWGFKDIVEQLLLFDADVNRKDIYHYTPLHWACDSGHLEVVQQLLWSSKCCSKTSLTKADVNAVDSDAVTALHVACGLGYENIIKELQIPELKVNAKDIKYGNTPLHWACRSGTKEAVQQLLKSNPDVNLRNIEGNTPLHLAVLKQHYDVVALMLAQAVDADNNNCLHLAVKKGVFHSEDETVEILDKFYNMLNLSKKERRSGTIVAMYLAYSGGNFHHKNKRDETPLDLIENPVLKQKMKTLFPSLCLLCEVNEPTVKFQPCGHTVTCKDCCLKIQRKTCPKCQQIIVEKSGFGRILGIKSVQLEIIKHDNPGNTEVKGFQTLRKWFTACDPEKRTLKTLRDALLEAECFEALECLPQTE
ncbi:E3 ubiquitin-protein ligase MIB2-like isoform X2 [Octopus vulgaris]|uniref:E3 ubiquitin-protein ligase MIB2-like isoform X2 n=1 Tax=Octopus vulgaris TaxID=6645 RepID=A0AA36HHZ1_OCTVU|nr:E3 ubiquitin-protein ligase MIB2-like isoform X2 [Octopus vulgaris]